MYMDRQYRSFFSLTSLHERKNTNASIILTSIIFIVTNVSGVLTRKRIRRFNESVIFS